MLATASVHVGHAIMLMIADARIGKVDMFQT